MNWMRFGWFGFRNRKARGMTHEAFFRKRLCLVAGLLGLGILVCQSILALDANLVEKKLAESRATPEKEIVEFKKLVADALRRGAGLDDKHMQEKAHQVHALLRKYYFDPRNNMVYTIIEPHTGQVVFPTEEDVRNNLPNANGWSTCIEDCAGYGNGRHLAWLAARCDVTRRPEHAEFARAVFTGLCTLGEIREETKPFRAIVRGVLPDGKTFYVGKGPGPGRSTGDNYTGYCFGMWTYFHSPFASDAEKERIRAIIHGTDPRSGGAFAAMAGDITSNKEFMDRYETRKAPALESLAEQTATTDQSWTAVQRQIHYTALRKIDPDPLCRKVYEHAMRANAWGRCKDILAGLDFDPNKDDYAHRVKTVRNPLDGMLAVMLSEDREAIETLLPLYRLVIERYDFAAFRDQRQLTPFLGAYWLAVKQGFLRYDPSLPEPDLQHVYLTPLDPNHTPVLTYFADCDPAATGVDEGMNWLPGPPNWKVRIREAQMELREGILRIQSPPKGNISFEAISEPWLRRASNERGYSIEARMRIASGTFVIAFEDGDFSEELAISPDKISLKNIPMEVKNTAAEFAQYKISVKGNRLEVQKDGTRLFGAELKQRSSRRQMTWGVRSEGRAQCEVDAFSYTVADRFRYPHSDSK
ncbi:MAG: hypothetical protein AB1696_02045 [Planctomycetota bacterium]